MTAPSNNNHHLIEMPIVAGPALTGEIAGTATVVDGDTVKIRGIRIRLHGIDAPESKQQCRRANGERWRCGR